MPDRIQVSSSASGPANFTFPTNPTFYDAQDSPLNSLFETLHGTAITHNRAWDGRERVLTWNGNEVGDATIASLDTYFRSVEGEFRYFNFLDIDDLNTRWPVDDTWKKARIMGLSATYKTGGKLRINSLSIKIRPEQ